MRVQNLVSDERGGDNHSVFSKVVESAAGDPFPVEVEEDITFVETPFHLESCANIDQFGRGQRHDIVSHKCGDEVTTHFSCVGSQCSEANQFHERFAQF